MFVLKHTYLVVSSHISYEDTQTACYFDLQMKGLEGVQRPRALEVLCLLSALSAG